MTLKRLMILVGILVLLFGVGIVWLWEYAYSPQGRARVIFAQIADDKDSLRGWMLKHELIRKGFEEPERQKFTPISPDQNSATWTNMLGTGLPPEHTPDDPRIPLAAQALARIGPGALPVVLERLRSSNSAERHTAIKACGKLHALTSIEPLIQCMLDAAHYVPGVAWDPERSPHDVEVERWCMESLVEIGPQSYGPLLEASQKCSNGVAYTLPVIMVQTWGSAAQPQLMKLITDTDPPSYCGRSTGPSDSPPAGANPRDGYAEDIVRNIRCESIRQLGKLKDPAAIDLLAAHLKDEWAIAMFSADALGDIGGPKADSVLLKAMGDPQIHPMVRTQAAEKLGQAGRQEGIKFLLAALKSPKSEDRSSAAQSLGLAKIKEAFGPLTDLLHDNDEGVRLEAVRALGQLGDPRAIPALKELLKDPSSAVRPEAAGILRSLQAAGQLHSPKE